MISDDLIQAAIITKLKANTALTNWLDDRNAFDEIREAEWQGRNFVYPAVRVSLGTQVEIGNPPCGSEIPFTIFSFTEGDSSLECRELAGLVATALLRNKLTITGFETGIILAGGQVGARRTTERVWQATGLYRTSIYGGV